MINIFIKIWKAIKSFFSLKWVKWVVLGVLVVLFIALTSTISVKNKQLKEYKQEVIVLTDSLKKTTAPICNYEVKLQVTDNSSYLIKGSYNKGTITTPSTKTYVLKIDSASVTVKPE